MSVSPAAMPTIGEIARRLTEPIHRVAYVIRARNIPACGRAGNARVFSEQAVEKIALELELIDAGKIKESEKADSVEGTAKSFKKEILYGR
jgi:hypothetical protein